MASQRRGRVVTSIVVDSRCADGARRERLYQGDLFVVSQTRASQGLAALARELLEAAFAPWPPTEAQHSLCVEEYAAILSTVKPTFIHHPRCEALIAELLEEVGADPSETYFDVPRLRSATANNYLTSGIAYAFHPHRDTWYSAPQAQINWWLPVYDIVPENAMAVYPDWFSQCAPNSSDAYNYYRWNAESRASASLQIGTDTRVQPHLTERIDLDNELRLTMPVGGILAFSGHQLHATAPNTTSVTRFSIDFRTVHIGDLEFRRGAPKTDVYCTGTTLRDFRRTTDLAPLSPRIVEQYDDASCLEYAESLVFAPSQVEICVSDTSTDDISSIGSDLPAR
jgi:hypothetical protein